MSHNTQNFEPQFEVDFARLITLLIFVLMVTMIMCSCGPNYHLRKSQKHIDKAISKGANVKEKVVTKIDTVKIEKVKDVIKHVQQIDTLKLIEECEEIKTNPKAVTRIADIVCPEKSIDTTYYFDIHVQGKVYKLPVRVKIDLKGSEANYSLESQYFNIPVIREERSQQISSGMSTWNIVILALCALVCGFGIGLWQSARK